MTASPPGPLSPEEITRIAAEVSLLMQADRLGGRAAAGADPVAAPNLPDHIARIFEAAGAVAGPLDPDTLYALVNRRIAELQAQLYLMRIELAGGDSRDPQALFDDPRVIAAYGTRMEGLGAMDRTFSFDPALLAHGWYPAESDGVTWHRWMRPGEASIVCLPHLGRMAQRIEITGQVLEADQLDGLTVGVGAHHAAILPDPDLPVRFVARLDLAAADLPSAHVLPVEFRMQDFRQPGPQDSRLLGASISRFVCRARGADTAG